MLRILTPMAFAPVSVCFHRDSGPSLWRGPDAAPV